ncbi:hypothetical protein J661_0534 [Acinetobacter baumannii 1391434]|nr:hypothetical protein J661_0534 [Acinetobacter baumannii 1391434]
MHHPYFVTHRIDDLENSHDIVSRHTHVTHRPDDLENVF